MSSHEELPPAGGFADPERLRSYVTAAQRFREASEATGGGYHEAYDQILAGVMVRLSIDPTAAADDPVGALGQALRDHGVQRILDLGCGSAGFLRALLGPVGQCGGELVGVDLDPRPHPETRAELARAGVQVVRADMRQFWDQRGFDLICCSGVMSLWGAFLGQDPRLLSFELAKAVRNAGDMCLIGVSLLTDHPRAALLTNTRDTFLLLVRKEVEHYAQVLYWDAAPRPHADEDVQYIVTQAARELWARVYAQAASFAVLAPRPRPDGQGPGGRA